MICTVSLIISNNVVSKFKKLIQLDRSNSLHSSPHDHTDSYDKSHFSILPPEVSTILKQKKRKEIVIVGIEEHICALQTAMGE